MNVDEPALQVLRVIREESRARCNLCDPATTTERTRMKCPCCLKRICDIHRSRLYAECRVQISETRLFEILLYV